MTVSVHGDFNCPYSYLASQRADLLSRAAVMWPQEDITGRLASPDLPSLLLRDTELARIVRRSGGTIVRDGGPLTADGWQRIRRWRQEWLALPSQVIPAVTGRDRIVRPGIEGLRHLKSRRH